MTSPKMRIAIVVHGRFFAFDLARALIRQGHDVVVFTNYPKRIAARFGLPAANVRTIVWHGVLSRAADAVSRRVGYAFGEKFLHTAFSRWAARRTAAESWDVLHAYSGVAEELFAACAGKRLLKALVRASSHIRVQDRLLSEEEKRVRRRVERPSPWMIAREEREYAAADAVFVLSTFAKNTFLEQGYPSAKLKTLLLAADLRKFVATERAVAERVRRILSGAPLRVLTVGTFSYRKGAYDLAAISAEAGPRFEFRFVGSVLPEAEAARRASRIEFVGKLPEAELPGAYEWADVFLFPTLEDGYPVVLAQAHAAGLPVITSFHCSGPDLLDEGKDGWSLPPRDAGAVLERLRRCDLDRPGLAAMAGRIPASARTRDWSDVASDFVRACAESAGVAP